MADQASKHFHQNLYLDAGFAEEMNPTKRNTMEDCHSIIRNFMGRDDMSFFAVYDGHGGRSVAEFVETALPINLATEIQHEKDTYPDRLPDILSCFERAYLMTDLQSSKQEGHEAAGATAVTCLLCKEGDQRVMYTANIGDSRAILYENGKTTRLSHDHKSDDPGEAGRVARGGGFLLKGRVLGVLAVARAFGDRGLKRFVPARPAAARARLAAAGNGGGGGGFAVLACDGVWDVFGDEEAAAFVACRLEAGRSLDQIAQDLVQEAVARDSTDNITALIIGL